MSSQKLSPEELDKKYVLTHGNWRFTCDIPYEQYEHFSSEDKHERLVKEALSDLQDAVWSCGNDEQADLLVRVHQFLLDNGLELP